MIKNFRLLSTGTFFIFIASHLIAQKAIGVFDRNADIGNVVYKGSVQYNPGAQQYIISGSGVNIWGTHDEFHYACRKLKGNFILQTRAVFLGKGVDPHRKIGWMVRTGLDTNSRMVLAAVHGKGLTSLQYRKEQGGNVSQDTFTLKNPDMIQLERKGSRFIMSVAHFGEPYTTTQVENIDLGDDVYVGLFVCSHNKNAMEKARFDNVRIIKPIKENFIPYREYISSSIETMDIATGTRKLLYTDTGSLQAPNWTPDNRYLIYNTNKGLMYRFDLKTYKSQLINTGEVRANNNDHVLSFDGQTLGLSSRTPEYNSIVYTVPVQGGMPKKITPTGPSYLHGFSPDGRYLVFTGGRNNNFDIYKIPVNGGSEIRLTTDSTLDDGPEYSPDGKFIYFNSVRTGRMQLWRMKPDGSNQEQITFDDYNNWFPHISPNGKWIAFLSFLNDINPNDHPFYRRVYLRLMPISGGKPKVITYLYGGQGSINTPSWSPDSKQIAFVSNSDRFD
jgi:regulation of enolase protein 1 (concanavalin A-like superfamily)